MTVNVDLYCPYCGHECVVASDDDLYLETRECAKCGNVMLEEPVG